MRQLFSRGKNFSVTGPWISKGIAGISTRLEPRALRELHGHATTDERRYVIDGDSDVTMIGSHGRHHIEETPEGALRYIPQEYGHLAENVGLNPSRVLIGFNTGKYSTIDVSQRAAICTRHKFRPAEFVFDKFPKHDVLITNKTGK